MPFSSSFCLTNTGSLQLGTSVDFYSDEDNYTDPFQTDILLSNITGVNCPYVLNGIPNGTTTLQINDTNSSCCVTIPISQNTICDICDLGFDVYSSSTISVIVAGNLTGSCDVNITDYLINWYDVSDLNTPVFTSGRGTEFTPYGFLHPLTGLQSVPVLSGEYVPVIQKIKLNGINYSNQLETGFVQASLNCFENVTVQVESFTCSNGDQTGDYDHLIRYSGASVDLTPPSVQSTFELSPTTNYIAWRFNGFDVPDSFKLTYYGSFYDTPIVLEYWTIGNDIVGNNLSLTPRQLGTPGSSSGFNKVTCLTGLTRSVNDFLVIEITPNPLNNVTNYSLLFTCLEEFDCNTCFNTYLNTPYKIIGSTISGQTLSCNRVNIYFKLSGCGFNDLTLTDTYKYVYNSLNRSPFTRPGVVGYNGQPIDLQVTLSNSVSGCNTNGNQFQVACSPTLLSTITFTKNNSGPGGQGNIYITFDNQNDFNAYYNSYLTQMSAAAPISNDNTTFNYYKYLQLQSPDYRFIPNPENLGCGDGSGRVEYLIHTSSVVTTGFTSGLYTLNITMPTITSGMTFTNCQSGCEYYMNDIVGDVNTSSLTTGNNQSYTNNKGSRVTDPFYRYTRLFYYTGGTLSQNISSYEETSTFFNSTYPMSGSSYNLIPSLYSQLCPLYGESFPNFYYGAVRKYQFFYRTTSTNPNNLLDFTIEASPIINGAPTYTYVLIYQIQNGTVIYSDPNYII